MVSKSELIDEFRAVLSVTLFFLICFSFFAILKKAFLAQYEIEYRGFVSAFVGALVLGKVVVILDHIKLTNKYKHLPNIFSVLFRSLIYLIGYIAFSYVEHIVIGLFSGNRIIESISNNTHHLMSHEGLATLIVLSITFIFFNAFWVIRTHIGPKQLFALYFKEPKEDT